MQVSFSVVGNTNQTKKLKIRKVSRKPMVNEHLRTILDDETWLLYFKRLTVYANKLIESHYWRGEQNGPVPGGKEAEDFATEAILDVYTGKRAWDPKQEPELLRHLFGVVKSAINNRSTQEQNKRDNRLDENEDYQERIESSNDPSRLQTMEDADFVLEICEHLVDEPELLEVAECIMDGCVERAEIAHCLKLTPNEVTNRRKRLKRKLGTYAEQFGLTA